MYKTIFLHCHSLQPNLQVAEPTALDDDALGDIEGNVEHAWYGFRDHIFSNLVLKFRMVCYSRPFIQMNTLYVDSLDFDE